MYYSYSKLKSEYEELLLECKIIRHSEALATAKRIIKLIPRYKAVEAETRVPALWIAAINERESASNMRTYLGNGQSLKRITTLVPRGRGPFKSWEDGARDALHLDKIDLVKSWNWSIACYESELWNGFGPRNHGKHSGYVWAGTNIYDGGKYVSDGVWDPHYRDSQLGTIPIMKMLIYLDSSLDFDIGTTKIKPADNDPHPVPAFEEGSCEWLQKSLNTILKSDLDVDGIYGRRTKSVLMDYQNIRDLNVDGLLGTITMETIKHDLLHHYDEENAK
jgi:lysozyme family protein